MEPKKFYTHPETGEIIEKSQRWLAAEANLIMRHGRVIGRPLWLGYGSIHQDNGLLELWMHANKFEIIEPEKSQQRFYPAWKGYPEDLKDEFIRSFRQSDILSRASPLPNANQKKGKTNAVLTEKLRQNHWKRR